MNDGGPAFPVITGHSSLNSSGMTLRDYFAAKAMQGVYANPELSGLTAEHTATWAYAGADAMLAERNKQP